MMLTKRPRSKRSFEYVTALLCLLAAPCLATAQAPSTTMVDFAAGSEFESYLRALQDLGIAPAHQWSIRQFSHPEVSRLAAGDTLGPWKLAESFSKAGLSGGSATLRSIVNTAYPYGSNDGPIWAGRGLTLAADAGVSGHAGPFSFTLDPIVFTAQNLSFPLLSNGQTGKRRFEDGLYLSLVDLPQRFGDSRYSRSDPGQSYVRMDTRIIAAGVSTANEWIGPGSEYAFLLSNNAPGFPHVFVGTGEPWNLWLFKVSSRAMWGVLDQSPYSPVTGSIHFDSAGGGTKRLAASITGVIVPRSLPGLEIGGARFFHVPYTASQPNSIFWRKPFRAFFLKNEFASGDTTGADNQLASVFFRWVFPKSGLEVYGERGYEDQFFDIREFLENPDHDREYMIGFQKVFSRPGVLNVIKGEVANYQLTTQVRLRNEGVPYVHSTLRQGHTNRGQLLGIGVEPGAAASTLSWTRYTAKGGTTYTLKRIARLDNGDYEFSGVANSRSSDVLVALGAERMRFGQRIDFGGKLEVMQDFNRNFSSDVPNLNFQLSARLHR